jgi:hypothetical protein
MNTDREDTEAGGKNVDRISPIVNGVSVLENCGTMQPLTFTRSYHSTLLFSIISALFVVSDRYYTCVL